ncbi:MAG: DsrE/DsrF/DrsH-like family protein [Gammaproteobacteria bacterium]|nr:DsrE/DsrF/DrsH-like family protein [Gammaproteobacteria bacterium]
MKIFKSVLMMVAVMLAAGSMAATQPDDSDALAGVKTGKVIFDINMTDAKKMTLYLMVIDETVEDLKKQGVTPDVILAFRGLSVRLISKDREPMELTDDEHLDKIEQQLAALQKKGVKMEACSVATRLFRVKNEDLLDGIKAVGNTFVSLTGYQAQGYANIPIY